MRRNLRRPFCVRRKLPLAAIPLSLTVLVTLVFLIRISIRLRPIIETMAVSNAVNQISLAINNAAAESLSVSAAGYNSFVNVTADANGRVSSLTINAAESGIFKSDFILRLFRRLEEIDAQSIAVPIGNLSGVLWLSALGPDVRVAIRSVSDVSADYESEFVGAGVNQTRHVVYLRVSVTVQLMIPGDTIAVTSEERVCIAETVIVGEVPNTYLNLQNGDN